MQSGAHLITLAMCALLSAGCTTTIEVGGPVQPSVVSPQRLPSTVAVILSEQAGSGGVTVRLGRVIGIPKDLYFDYGDVLSDALFRSVLQSYQHVALFTENPRAGQYDRILKVLVRNQPVNTTRPYLASANDQFTIMVTVEALNGSTLEFVQRTTVQRSVTYNGDSKSFEKAIERAIQQLSDNVMNLLMAGFAEHTDGSRS